MSVVRQKLADKPPNMTKRAHRCTIGDEYDVAYATIKEIALGYKWRHVRYAGSG